MPWAAKKGIAGLGAARLASLKSGPRGVACPAARPVRPPRGFAPEARVADCGQRPVGRAERGPPVPIAMADPWVTVGEKLSDNPGQPQAECRLRF
jgi:hypothetical protein